MYQAVLSVLLMSIYTLSHYIKCFTNVYLKAYILLFFEFFCLMYNHNVIHSPYLPLLV